MDLLQGTKFRQCRSRAELASQRGVESQIRPAWSWSVLGPSQSQPLQGVPDANVGLSSQPGFDHALEPKVEYIMQVHIAQHDADRTALRGSLFVWIDFAVFQNACLQPAPDQADHARIADAVLHKSGAP